MPTRPVKYNTPYDFHLSVGYVPKLSACARDRNRSVTRENAFELCPTTNRPPLPPPPPPQRTCTARNMVTRTASFPTRAELSELSTRCLLFDRNYRDGFINSTELYTRVFCFLAPFPGYLGSAGHLNHHSTRSPHPATSFTHQQSSYRPLIHFGLPPLPSDPHNWRRRARMEQHARISAGSIFGCFAFDT